MTGLALANTIQEADERAHLASQLDAETEAMLDDDSRRAPDDGGDDVPPAQVRHDFPIPNPPDLRTHVLTDYNLEDIFGYINPQMLYVRHLGYKGRFAEDLEAGEQAAIDLRDSVRPRRGPGAGPQRLLRQRGLQVLPLPLRRAIPANLLARRLAGAGAVLLRAPVPARRPMPRRLRAARISNSLSLRGRGGGVRHGLRGHVRDQRRPRRPRTCRAVDFRGQIPGLAHPASLALESAEGFAELLHQQLRQMWGFGDPAGITPYDLFRTQYRGRRFSFGYPACPRLEDQEQLFRLLEVSRHLDVELTEGYMMDPESTVSALVFHHPDAKYFNLSERDITRLEAELGG